MSRHSIAEAKNNLSKLVSRARRGEDVELTLRGEVVARITPSNPLSAKLDFEDLQRRQVKLGPDVNWTDVIRQMRDEGY